ncbi:MAG: glycosyltransferase family 2 protein [Psychroserpens sp.]|uniref:glycosyltransferase family 2 protein n=1 Tax=Psychroserpens sp. TaxID=2020870 RepID=UPI003C715009
MFTEIILDCFYYVLIGNLCCIALLSGLRIYFIEKSSSSEYISLNSDEPFVSIHYAICDEPPIMVLDTLNSFRALEYSNFEVIIVSNNHTNEHSWKPIEAFCQSFTNFHFFHFDKIDGFKAGALNIALDKMSSNCEYIFTVDADYQLKPSALKIAVGTLIAKGVDLLQFPQDYRNVCDHTEGLQVNYKHYFECYLSSMDVSKTALPTGTLSLIKTGVFRTGLKWPSSTITEDAHFGINLLSNGFKIGFSNISIGLGTMPTTVVDYSKQSKRWVFGNFQTLILTLRQTRLSIKKKFKLYTMLSAWINLLAIPIIITFITIPLIFIYPEALFQLYLLIFLSVMYHALTQMYILNITSMGNWRSTLKAFLIHTGTIEIGAFYWLTYFIKRDKPFIRTNKYLVSSNNSLIFYLLPILLFVASIALVIVGKTYLWMILFPISVVAMIGKIQLENELAYSKLNLFQTMMK